MKVYVITKGAYSDYHICGVATDKKKAEILRKAFSNICDKAEIETYETDQFITEIESGFKLYDCALKDGEDLSISTYLYGLDCLDYMTDSDFRVRRFSKGWCAPGYGIKVWAKDEDHARKIAADKIAEYKARKAGI